MKSLYVGLVYEEVKLDHITEVWVDYETSIYVNVDSFVTFSDKPFDCGGYLYQVYGTDESDFVLSKK